MDPIQILPGQLSSEALHSVVEEFVTRDGTDLVEGDLKVEQVLRALDRGDAELWFDGVTGTCSIRRAPGAR